AAAETDHFHPKGKPPSKHTIAKLEEARAALPLSDRHDFEEQKKGFIAAPESRKIMADAGHVAWDMDRYQFLLDGKDFDSIHPSQERQAKLNMNFGLYEVVPGIYQVRGFDLANISFVKGEKGWIVFDPLTAAETARAALALVDEHLGKRPIVAVVYSHSHADHFGGVRGIVKEEDVRAGKVEIIAPFDFMNHAVSENVYAGNAMSRLTVDGVKMIFQNTPNTEAPSEMNTYFPELKVLWMAENVTGTIHNIYTLRGALVRDALAWSKYINEALYMFGRQADVMFASHHWPRWGNARVQEVLRAQRDAYAHLNNQVLHLANQGVTINEIHNVYEVPPSLQEKWYARGYHGSPEHNSRGVINRYLGYWDANPATLIPLSPADSAPLYAEMMGGAEKIMGRATKLYEDGAYMLASEILNKLVYAEPGNQAAKDLLADVFEQIGYQQENPGLRNSFLAAAYELRSGIPSGASPKTAGPDMIRAMSTGLFLDFVAIRMDSKKAEGMEFTINLVTPDTGEEFIVELSNATLTNIEGRQAEDADLTITIDRSDLEQTMMGVTPFSAQIESGKASLEGKKEVFDQLVSTLVDFELGFEIMPGTKGPGEPPEGPPLQVNLRELHE
ncbi:MAG: MBL fold metallo-hydrolase, partial [Deltaproteobacteria bacterium]|nr:MBL fold metallo-hydrolase [Deltaproteobacteria bacterium]